jgi:hypothetical protein
MKTAVLIALFAVTAAQVTCGEKCKDDPFQMVCACGHEFKSKCLAKCNGFLDEEIKLGDCTAIACENNKCQPYQTCHSIFYVANQDSETAAQTCMDQTPYCRSMTLWFNCPSVFNPVCIYEGAPFYLANDCYAKALGFMESVPGKCGDQGFLYPDSPDLEKTSGEDICGCKPNDWNPVCVKTDFTSYTFSNKCLAECKQKSGKVDWTNGVLTEGACVDPCHDNPCRVTGDHCIAYKNQPRCEKDSVNNCVALCEEDGPVCVEGMHAAGKILAKEFPNTCAAKCFGFTESDYKQGKCPEDKSCEANCPVGTEKDKVCVVIEGVKNTLDHPCIADCRKLPFTSGACVETFADKCNCPVTEKKACATLTDGTVKEFVNPCVAECEGQFKYLLAKGDDCSEVVDPASTAVWEYPKDDVTECQAQCACDKPGNKDYCCPDPKKKWDNTCTIDAKSANCIAKCDVKQPAASPAGGVVASAPGSATGTGNANYVAPPAQKPPAQKEYVHAGATPCQAACACSHPDLAKQNAPYCCPDSKNPWDKTCLKDATSAKCEGWNKDCDATVAAVAAPWYSGGVNECEAQCACDKPGNGNYCCKDSKNPWDKTCLKDAMACRDAGKCVEAGVKPPAISVDGAKPPAISVAKQPVASPSGAASAPAPAAAKSTSAIWYPAGVTQCEAECACNKEGGVNKDYCCPDSKNAWDQECTKDANTCRTEGKCGGAVKDKVAAPTAANAAATEENFYPSTVSKCRAECACSNSAFKNADWCCGPKSPNKWDSQCTADAMSATCTSACGN